MEGPRLSVGLWAVGGIVTSLVVEKFMRYVTGRYAHIQGYRWKSGLEDRSILKRRSKAQRNKKKEVGYKRGGSGEGTSLRSLLEVLGLLGQVVIMVPQTSSL